MKATVRAMISPDVDLATYAPANPLDVCVFIQLMVGPLDDIGEESLDLQACTPRWLERHVRENGPMMGRHYVIVERWDYAVVTSFLKGCVEREEASTWGELGTRLARIGRWEFEDYHD